MATCPNCGNETLEGAVFCDQCGTPIPAPEPSVPAPAPAPAGGSVICSACGAGNVPGEAFCDFCGSPLEAPEPSAEAVAELEAVSAEAELVAVPTPAGTEAQETQPQDVKPTCPACGADVLADETFCANCGAALAQAPIPPEPEDDVEAEPAAAETEVEPTVDAQPVAEAAEEPVAEAPAEAVPEVEPAPVAVAEEAEPVPEAPPLPGAPNTCPACGAEVESGDKFCSNCGAAQTITPAPAIEPAAPPPPPAPSTGPRLVVADSGAEIPLPAGPELLIGREDPVSGIFPDINLTPHGGEEGGVSRRHARLVLEDGSYAVEDLDSTNFSFVNKQKLAPGIRQPLNDGDELRCGRVAMILRIT